jgi:5-hydroxyisourate hydrolase-like protein (transthyretin family)
MNNPNEKQGQAVGAGSGPSLDKTTGQPIEEAEDNLSRHSTKDSSPSIAEQDRTTEKGRAEQPRTGSELRDQDDGANQ